MNKQNLTAGLCLGALSLAACSTTSVTPIGKDTYMVAGTKTGYSSGGEVLADLYAKGYKYCAQTGLTFVPVHEQSKDGVPGVALASASIQFRCVAEDDAEAAARPKFKPAPNVVIENHNE